MALVNLDSFTQSLGKYDGSMYLDSTGNLGDSSNAAFACYDLRTDPKADKWPRGKIIKLTKIIIGVIVTLFILLLIIGVIVGLFAYSKTDDNGTSYDVFFGQGLRFGIKSAITWEILMGLLGLIAASSTLEKWYNYSLMSNGQFKSGYIGECAKQCQLSANNWTW